MKSVTRTSEQLRGGMIHRSYRAEFDKKTLRLNVYVLPDGKSNSCSFRSSYRLVVSFRSTTSLELMPRE